MNSDDWSLLPVPLIIYYCASIIIIPIFIDEETGT